MARPLLLLGGLAALAVSAAGTVGSGAAFVTETAPKPASARAAVLQIGTDREGQAIVASTAGLRPGDIRTGLVDVSNAGEVAAPPRFSVESINGSALAGVIRITLERCGTGGGCPSPVTETTGTPTLSSLSPVTLGTLAVGATRRYRVTLTWPSNETSASLQGVSTSAQLVFRAEAGS